MAHFYNAETKEPLSTLYISSSRKADFVLSAPEVPIRHQPSLMAMRKPKPSPEVTLRIKAGGTGRIEKDFGRNPKTGDYRLADLRPAARNRRRSARPYGRVIATIPVKIISDCGSYKPIMKRFNSRGMKVELDSHIAYVCYASDIVGEGISFVPRARPSSSWRSPTRSSSTMTTAATPSARRPPPRPSEKAIARSRPRAFTSPSRKRSRACISTATPSRSPARTATSSSRPMWANTSSTSFCSACR